MINSTNRLKNTLVFLGLLSGLILAIVAGGYVWRGVFAVQLTTIVLCGTASAAYFYWRGIRRKAQLPMLGIELAVAAFVVALVASWIFSPDPRQGMDRLFLLLGYVVLLYILADAFYAGLNKQLVVAALLVSSGLLLALAGMEVYLRYLDWFKAVGSLSEWPPSVYRFVSFLGHTNALMTYANLIAPLCIVVWIKNKNIWVRSGALLWFVFFLIAIPFSSARASWLGTLTWAACLVFLWLLESGVWKKLALLAGKYKLQVGIGLVAGVALVSILAVVFYQFFGAHPSHGSSTFSGRFQMWIGAFQIWRHHFWFGTGPGRFPFDILNYDPTIPPSYWPSQAHNLVFQSVAEFGLVGGLCGLSLIIWTGVRVWSNYQQTSGDERIWSRAILVSLVGWLVQMMFDDQTAWAAVMVPLIILLAWLLTSGKSPERSGNSIGLNILAVPLGVILLISGHMLSLYWPFSISLEKIRQGNIPVAIQVVQMSLKDNNLSYYQTQAAMVYARQWGETKNIESLAKARELLLDSLSSESSPSLWWADLAVLDWYAGDRVTAVSHITKAMEISPLEPSYVLNYGWFMEESGRVEQATDSYEKVLNMNPEWSTHPYWQQSALRQAVIEKWRMFRGNDLIVVNPYSLKAFLAATRGEIKEERRDLAYAQWLGEPEIAIQLVINHMASESGKQQDLVSSYEAIEQLASSERLITTNSFASTYSIWVNGKEGLDFDLVPGYLQLQQDFGQYNAWQKWIDYQVKLGRCDEARKSARLLQAAMQGGSLVWEEPDITCP